jgi:hypothetical protein
MLSKIATTKIVRKRPESLKNSSKIEVKWYAAKRRPTPMWEKAGYGTEIPAAYFQSSDIA